MGSTPVSRAVLVAVLLASTALGAPTASAHPAALVLDGLRDPAYVLLAQDPSGDLSASFSTNPAWSWADLTNLYVTTDTANLWVYVDLPNYNSSQSTGEFRLAIDTDGLDASGGPSDPWGNAVTFAYTSTRNNIDQAPIITTSILLPDVVIAGLQFSTVRSPPGYTELRHWRAISSTWDGAAVNWGGVMSSAVGSHIAFANAHGLELSIPFADLAVPPTHTLHLEFYATGTRVVGHIQGAWDTIPPDTQALTDTTGTTQHRLATINPSLPFVLPLVSFSSASFATREVDGSTPITLTLAPTSTQLVSVSLSSSDGTAGPADYVALSQTVTFAPGQAARPIPLQVLTDTLAEPDETVHLILSQAVNARLSQPFTATLTIHDSPPPPPGSKLFLPYLRR